jgi:hypothetical protein
MGAVGFFLAKIQFWAGTGHTKDYLRIVIHLSGIPGIKKGNGESGFKKGTMQLIR